MRGSVTVHMSASPERVFELVSDVTNIGKYSPETFGAEWIDGATRPAVGARFRGHVKRNGKGPIYWTTCEIVECEPGKRFAFAVLTRGRPLNTWRYVIEPNAAVPTNAVPTNAAATNAGVDVTESFQLLDDVWWLRVYWALLGWARGKTNENGMRTTLERIKAEAELPNPR